MSAHAQWLDFLCSYGHEENRTRLVNESDIYGTLLETLGEVSPSPGQSPLVELLRFAYSVAPDHPCFETPTVSPSKQTQVPGNFHNALVHAALFGTQTLESTVLAARHVVSTAAIITPQALAVHASALAMLRCLHELKAHRPTRMDGKPMDPLPFAVACNIPTVGDQRELLVSLLGWYMKAGWLDLDARLDDFQNATRNSFPLDVALWAGGPAAAAFIDVGCNPDNPALTANASGHGVLEKAEEHPSRPETGPLVAAALMRRRMALREAEQAGEVRVARRRAGL